MREAFCPAVVKAIALARCYTRNHSRHHRLAGGIVDRHPCAVQERAQEQVPGGGNTQDCQYRQGDTDEHQAGLAPDEDRAPVVAVNQYSGWHGDSQHRDTTEESDQTDPER
jgi:hypothetical protein